MGLDDFISNKEYAIGSITTRKKPENLSIKEEDWKHLIMHDPHWATFFARNMDEQGIRCIIEMMDEMLEGEGTSYTDVSEGDIEAMEQERPELVELLKDEE